MTSVRTALGAKPLLLKIAPDLEPGQVEELAAGAEEHGFDGFVATNTTRSRPGVASSEPGGLSGRPLARVSLRILKQLVTASDLPVISVAGSTALPTCSSGWRQGRAWFRSTPA